MYCITSIIQYSHAKPLSKAILFFQESLEMEAQRVAQKDAKLKQVQNEVQELLRKQNVLLQTFCEEKTQVRPPARCILSSTSADTWRRIPGMLPRRSDWWTSRFSLTAFAATWWPCGVKPQRPPAGLTTDHTVPAWYDPAADTRWSIRWGWHVSVSIILCHRMFTNIVWPIFK